MEWEHRSYRSSVGGVIFLDAILQVPKKATNNKKMKKIFVRVENRALGQKRKTLTADQGLGDIAEDLLLRRRGVEDAVVGLLRIVDLDRLLLG